MSVFAYIDVCMCVFPALQQRRSVNLPIKSHVQVYKPRRLTSHVIPLKALFYVGLLETGELIRLSSISHTGAPLRGPSLLVSAKSMILPHIRAYLLGKVRLHRYICL